MASSNKTIAKLQKTAKSKYADLKEKAKEELKARKSRNPRTGATVFVENKRIPYFRMGKKLKERIN